MTQEITIVQIDKDYRIYNLLPPEDFMLVNPCDIIEYHWTFGDGEASTEKTPTHIYEECVTYIITLLITQDSGTTTYTAVLDLSKPLVLDFEISNNYGPAPLMFHVEDISDYGCTGFYPTRWTWYIIYFGCLITKYGYGNIMDFTVSVPGQYGLMMTVSDGSRTYSVTKRDIIFVTDTQNSDAVQIEFAHNSSPEDRRHLIKTTNDFKDPVKNSIQFYIWGTDLSLTDVAENELMEVRGDDKLITKNLYPKSNLIYYIGSELQRWNELVGKEADILTYTETELLRLWSGR